MAATTMDTSMDSSYVISQLALALYGLRTEIVIFFAAFLAHAVLFGRYRLHFRKPAHSSKEKIEHNTPPVSQEEHVKVSVTAHDICKGCSGKWEAVVDNLRRHLAKTPTEAVVPTLCGILQSAGRVPPVELLAAVRVEVKERSLPLNAQLGELLLRGYYACCLTPEFDALLTETEAVAAVKGECLFDGVGVQALKNVLRKGDFQSSLTRLEGIRCLYEAGPDGTPSAVPKALIQWIARLAVQQDSVPNLVDVLKKLGIFASTFTVLLTECAQHGSATFLCEMEVLGRKEGLDFDNAGYCVLLKSAEGLEKAMELFSEAVDRTDVSKELLAIAANIALKHGSTAFGDTILSKLPVDPPAEAAGNLIQLLAGGKMDHMEVLNLYTRHFSEVDLSGEVSAEQLVVEACIHLDRLDLLKKMLTTTADCTKRVALIKNLGAAGRLDDAFLVFRTFPEKGACLYNAVIDACIDRHQPNMAHEVMKEAIQANISDTVTYNTIIKAHLRAGNTVEAWKTVQLMKDAGSKPNCVTFNELLDACVQYNAGQVWPILAEMKASGVKANHITGSILLKTIRSDSSASNVERVLAVLDSMVEDMDEVLLSSVVEGCIRGGRPDLLLPYLKRQASSKRIHVQGAVTYGSIIRAYGFVKDVAGAWVTWREMRARHIVPTAVTLGCMVEAVVSNGDPEAGYELIHDMLNDEKCRYLVNAVVFGSVLKGLSHQKKFDRLWQVYQEMLVLKLKFSILTFNTLIDACSRSGEMSRIPTLVKSMVSQGIEPNLITYSAILKGYCQDNRLDEAFEVMETCKEKFKPDEIMYNSLLDGCARQGLYDRGIALLAQMEHAGITPSSFTLSVLVKLCSRSRRLDRAFKIVDEISSKYRFRPNVHVYNNLIQASIQHKGFRHGLEVLERLLSERIRPDIRTYSLLLRACVAAGEAQDAAGLMRAAVGLRGVHPLLMGYSANSLQPQGSLPPALTSEVIEGISGPCNQEALAVALLRDLRSKPNVKIDPKLQMRLTTRAVGSTR